MSINFPSPYYAKLFWTNLINLNLTICEKSTISIPIIINEELYKLDDSSEYYNNICYATTYEDGTDIIMKDRQNEYINKDRIIYQEDCYFSEYEHSNLKAICSCSIKKSSQSFADININKVKILDNFKHINI